MCLDPHAVAVINLRETLNHIEHYLRDTDTGKSSVSVAEYDRIAALRAKLDRCSACYSRRKSKRLFSSVLKEASELVVRVTETLPRRASVVHPPQWRSYAIGRDDSLAA
jgi:lipid-binding SYLF domain-containing protein